MVVLVGLTSAKSYAQIDFRVKSDNQNLIRVDEKISFSLEIENIRYSKVKVMYPIYEEQLFSFLKEEGGPWSEISTLRIIDGSYEITLKPGHIIKKFIFFFFKYNVVAQ
jgi:hypothetical protein